MRDGKKKEKEKKKEEKISFRRRKLKKKKMNFQSLNGHKKVFKNRGRRSGGVE